ncbi:MAG: ribosome recycling factor [Dehalococcoidia bacterium]|nr:ribosome recycling factor [Dehalococcoidia bacterium]MDD5648034.1 ribosome recycling factor [Dehalococcoidia bacterium]
MTDKILKNADSRMKKCIEALNKELSSIRTGRASPALVEHIKVDYFGVVTPLIQLASISVPDPKTISIHPWDRNIMNNIDKAILKSDLGLNPINDGNNIRISIPALTEDRRKDLIKIIHKRLEESRVTVRNIRREAVEELKTSEKNKEISQDQSIRASEQIQKLTDSYIDSVNRIGKDKEAEILEV